MRKIIYAWNYREWGGAQIYFMSLMKEAKKIYAVTALMPSDSEPKILHYLHTLDIPVEFLPPAEDSKGHNKNTGKLQKRRAILRSENVMVENILARSGLSDTIVHVDLGFWQSSLSLARLCRKTNVFATVHTSLPRLSGWRSLRWEIKGKTLSKFANFQLLASNQDAKNSLEPYINKRKFDKVEVTYSGIDPMEINEVTENLPSRNEIQQRYDLPDERPILISVGQFIERKGCWVVLESLKRLMGVGEHFIFLWLSTMRPDSETQNKIDSFGLGDSFRLMDANEIGERREDMLTLLSVADIFVLASLQEGLPIALIEAMALGLPCVTTNVNAIPEAISDGENGILIQPNDSDELCRTVATLLREPQQRKTLGAAAKKTAFEKFNEKISAERTVKLYDEVWQTSG